jgi:hypothetical protein
MINFSGPLGPLPPAPPDRAILTLSIIIMFARLFSLSHESPRHEMMKMAKIHKTLKLVLNVTRRGGGGSAGIGAERITAAGIIVTISKQHAETSHGINIAVDDCKTQGIEREKFRQITITATTDGGDRGPDDAAYHNALVFILQKDKAQNSGSEHYSTESSGSKN